MKISRSIMLTMLILLVMVVCLPVIVFAADNSIPNPLKELTWYVVTAAVAAVSGKFFSWLSKRLTKAKYVPESVIVWLDQIEDQDVINAINEARKLVTYTPSQKIEWARKYLQDRYKQLPSSVANQIIETKIQETIKTPQLLRL